MFVIDDLTKSDRDEKKKWKDIVQRAFLNKVRYHFSAGKWRDSRGMLAPFYAVSATPAPVATPIPEGTSTQHASPPHDRSLATDTTQSPPADLDLSSNLAVALAATDDIVSQQTYVQDHSSRSSTRVVTAQVHSEDHANTNDGP